MGTERGGHGTRHGRGASPWTLGGLTVPELVRRVWDRLDRQEVAERAAGLSYYFLFALFPTLLFLTALVGLLPGPRLMDHLMRYVDRALPGDAASVVRRTLDEVVAGASPGLISAGVLGALWAASTGMASIMAALNVARGGRDDRPWWKRRLIAIALTLGFSLFTITALLLLVFGEWIGEMLAAWVGFGAAFATAWTVVKWPAVILCVLAGITLVYDLAPARRQPWRSVSPGSVVALAGWLTMSSGLHLYVRFFGSYNATYGSIGGVILLMLWLYLTSLLLLTGAEIDSAIAEAARGGEEADDRAGTVSPEVEPATAAVTTQPPARGGKSDSTSAAASG